jgi:hypothetical protein
MIFTILSDLCGLGVFAGDIPSFGYGCSPEANLFFPAQSGKKRVLLYLKVCAACALFPAVRSEIPDYATLYPGYAT